MAIGDIPHRRRRTVSCSHFREAAFVFVPQPGLSVTFAASAACSGVGTATGSDSRPTSVLLLTRTNPGRASVLWTRFLQELLMDATGVLDATGDCFGGPRQWLTFDVCS